MDLKSGLVLGPVVDPRYKSMNFLSSERKEVVNHTNVDIDAVIEIENSLEQKSNKKQKLSVLYILLGPEKNENSTSTQPNPSE